MADSADSLDAPDQGFIADDPKVPEDSLRSIAFTAFLMLVGFVFLAQTMSIRSQAAIWPRGLALLLIALTALRLGLLFWQRRQAAATVAEQPRGPTGWGGVEIATRRRLFTAGWLVAYCLVAPLVGFGPAMLVFIPVYMWVCDFRRPLWIAAITIGAAVVMTLLFGSVANVPIWDARL